MTDLRSYVLALLRHWVGLLTGPVASLALLLWSVFARKDVPTWAFWVVAGGGVPVGGFLAWREEHEKLVGEASEEEREERERLRALASRVTDEFVDLARRRIDGGPHLLATLGLHSLGSDALIRKAIREMDARSGGDPWAGHAQYVADVDLVRFFGWVRDHRIDFSRTTVEAVARDVRGAGGVLPRAQ